MSAGEKQLLRNQIRQLQANDNEEEVLAASTLIRSHLEAFPEFQSASVVYAYAPLRGEPDWILDGLPPGKTYAFPRTTGRHVDFIVCEDLSEMTPGAFGVLTPPPGPPAPPPDLILVPGMAFDVQGNRMGHGHGIYDLILKTFPGYRLGVVFFKQLFPSVPFEPHDEPVEAILTEDGVQLSAGGTVHHQH
jgi:5-formyltetrahydrofolate cyclo-ligase